MAILRELSLIFSRSAIEDLIRHNDYTKIDNLISRYRDYLPDLNTYATFYSFVYQRMKKSYRCEYLFKNEIISKILIKKYGSKNAVAFNEFKVHTAIADIVIFNGESKVFEIKTEFDSPARLRNQLNCYRSFFDKCYLVVAEDKLKSYIDFTYPDTGIITLTSKGKSIVLTTVREASQNDFLDIDTAMQVLHTGEYKNIILDYFGFLPDVSCFELFDACSELMRLIPYSDLRAMIISEIKKRKNNFHCLKQFPSVLRQSALAMNLTQKQLTSLSDVLNTSISHHF